MKTKSKPILGLILAFILQPTSAPAQGSLTPPGPPAATMKTLDQLDSKLEKRIPISTLPLTITTPGSYYLTNNINYSGSGDGIAILASNVTIDLNGFTLAGSSAGFRGIWAQLSYANVVVKNGAVCHWGNCGVSLDTKDSRIEGVHAYSNGLGIGLSGGGIMVDSIAATNQFNGIQAGPGSVLRNCAAHNNTGDGFAIEKNSTMTGCTASGNDRGFILTFGHSILQDSTASKNLRDGIVAGDHSRVSNCTVTENRENGIRAGSYTTISGCNSSANWMNGIQVAGYCQVRDNNCGQNGNEGTYAGIHATGNGNRIDGNQSSMNANTGIKVDTIRNLIIRNCTSVNFTTAYNISAGNTVGPIHTASGTITTENPWANFDLY
jgi:hypothetical protein